MSQALQDKTQKIKICQVVSVDMTLKFMLQGQLKFLLREGYEVHAVSSPGRWLKEVEGWGVKVKPIHFTRKITPLVDLIAFLKLYFYFRKEKFDIIHTHTLKPEVYGQIAAKLAGVPIILNTLHGFDFGPDDSSLKKKLIIFLQKIAGRCSTTIFSIAHHIIDRAIKEGIARPEVFKYLGRDIDTKRFDPQRFSEGFRRQKKKEVGIPPGKRVVGIVARLVAEKGLLELFEAFKGVVEKFPDTILLVIGPEEPEKRDGITAATAKEYKIEDKTIFLGERADTDELYPLMDIFVLPTHREGLGASILEASAMERPVIATRTGGCPETIDHQKTGLIVPLKSSPSLKEAIIYLLSDPEEAVLMGKEGRKKVLREFEQQLVFDRMKREYERLIKEKLK